MVFFVISGFLITSLSFRRWGALSNINLREFYTLRFARIVPLLIAVLAISSALQIGKVPGFIIDPHRTSFAATLWSAITLHINVLEVPTREHLPGNWDVLWSLSIEEVFYLAFPLLCKLLKKEWALYSFMLILIVAGPFSRALNSDPVWSDHAYFSCFDGIAIGFFAAVLANRARLKNRAALALWIFGCAAAIFAVVCKYQVYALGLYRTGLDVTLLEIATACIILGLRPRKIPGATLLSAPLRWLGRDSYEIYLTHCFLIIPAGLTFRAWHAALASQPVWFLALICLSGLLGWLVARVYSEPMNRSLRQRLLRAPFAARVEPQPEADVSATV